MWQFVSTKLDSAPKNRQINGIANQNHIITDDFAKANHFHEYFRTVVSTLNDGICKPIQQQVVPEIPFNQHTML